MQWLNELNTWAKASPAEDYWFWVIIILLGTIVSFFFAFHYLHRKRLIEDTPTSKIRSAAQGYLELIGSGQLMDGQPIIAPLTGSHCTWYDFTIEQNASRDSDNNWKVIRKGISDELFLLRDDTGECVIDPEGASVFVSEKDVWYGNQVTPMRKPLHTRSKFNMFRVRTGNYRYTERRLEINEPLYAIGLFKTVGGSGAKLSLNDDVREVISEWKKDSEWLLKQFDTNNDGEIDMEEWQKVREAALKKVMANHEEQKNLPPVHLLARTHDKRRPFILSAFPQEHLTRKLLWYSAFCFSIFLIAGFSSAWLITIRLAT